MKKKVYRAMMGMTIVILIFGLGLTIIYDMLGALIIIQGLVLFNIILLYHQIELLKFAIVKWKDNY